MLHDSSVSFFHGLVIFCSSRIRCLPVYLPLKLGCKESYKTRSSSVCGVNCWLICLYLARISSPGSLYFFISSSLADRSARMRERCRNARPREHSGHFPRPALLARSMLSLTYRLSSVLARANTAGSPRTEAFTVGTYSASSRFPKW